MKKLLASLVCLVVVPACADAERTDEISSEAASADSRIRITRVATLGKSPDTVSLSRMSKAAMDSQGRFYVTPTFSRGQIAMYDRRGRFVRSFGRRGRGPGEFNLPNESR